jgi:hypothetical protein
MIDQVLGVLIAAAIKPGTVFTSGGTVAKWVGLTRVADIATVGVMQRLTGPGAGTQRAYSVSEVLGWWRVATC